jgi:hypothetical protein
MMSNNIRGFPSVDIVRSHGDILIAGSSFKYKLKLKGLTSIGMVTFNDSVH